ncbi:MAG: putative bifunctional diguanylate cyclase/phosphodiesterase [Cyanophyceae cyanobacterium]
MNFIQSQQLQINNVKLPNRLALPGHFEHILQKTKTREAKKSTLALIPVFYINLDRFSRINNTFGNRVGDDVLRTLAQRLLTGLRPHETLAYLSANEFAVVCAAAPHVQAVTKRAQTFLDCISQPIEIEQQDLFITASVGVALYPSDGLTIERLLQQANKAMLSAKQQGGNQYRFYTSADKITLISSNSLTLEADLRHALEREEFELYYQPQINLRTEKITGAEALLRWNHPQRENISPATFIPIAEESGLVEPIGEWTLHRACQQTFRWHQAGFNDFHMAVNLSGRQFKQLNLHQNLIKILMQARLNPRFLKLELTESILIENATENLHKLNLLKSLGFQIAIDDFGTGYSSFSYLKQFPFDILKIDRCFIQNIHQDAVNAAITTAIISMAHQLDLKVIAEGVENQAELEFLQQQQCDEVQGYFVGPPLPQEEFEELLANNLKSPVEP